MSVLYVRSTNLPYEKVGGDLVLVDAVNGFFCTSNQVGAFIWEELSEPRTSDDLCDAIVHNFDGAEPSAVKNDVEEFLDSLLSNDLVEQRPL